MNKAEFLNELETRIRILEKNEIKDILNEYSQHIDMEIQNSISEEDAIKDFGDIDDLAAEILEAYHVNPDFSVKKEDTKAEEEPEKKANEDKKKRNIFTVIIAFFTSFFTAFGRCIERWVHFFGKIFRGMGNGFKKIFGGVKSGVKNVSDRPKNPKKEKKENKKVNSGGKKMFDSIWLLTKRVFILLFLVPAAFMTVSILYALGVVLVMLFQGYPLMGVVMILAGMTICGICFSLFLVSFMKRNHYENIEYYDDTVVSNTSKKESHNNAPVYEAAQNSDENITEVLVEEVYTKEDREEFEIIDMDTTDNIEEAKEQ